MSKPRILEDDINYIKQQVGVLFDMPEDIEDDNEDNQMLFDLIVRMIELVKDMVSVEYITDLDLKFIDAEFKECVQSVLSITMDVEVISNILTYVQCKVAQAVELALDMECYETFINIQKWQDL